MLRKLLLAVAATAAGALFASTASANDPRDDFRRQSDFRRNDSDRHSARFVVQVRHGWHWHEVGSYCDRDDFKKLLADLEAKFPREVLPAPRKVKE